MAVRHIGIRPLCESTIVLGPIPVTGSEHPVGCGLPAKLQYKVAMDPPHRLPREGETLDQLQELLRGTAAPGMGQEESKRAWHALLSRPALLVPLNEPNSEDLLREGIVVPSSIGSLRQVGLAAVLVPEEDKGIATPGQPVAGVARLITASAEGRPASTTHGWMIVKWARSVNALSRALEGLWLDAPPSVRTADKRHRAVLLDLQDAPFSHEDIEVITACCAVFDFQLSVHHHVDKMFRHALQAVRERPPRLLLRPVHDASGQLDTLVAAYTAARPEGDTLQLLNGPEGLLPDLRENLAHLAKVTPGLLPLFEITPTEDSSEAAEAGLRMLLDRLPGYTHRGRHPMFRHFVKGADGYWYSKDLAGHGGSVFKVHVERGGELIWKADLDGSMQPIDGKYKGDTGRVIPLDEIRMDPKN